jgi:hypothetical protein
MHTDTISHANQSYFLLTKDKVFCAYRMKGKDCELLWADSLEAHRRTALTEGNRILFRDLDRDGAPEILVEVAYSDKDPNYVQYTLEKDTTLETTYYYSIYKFKQDSQGIRIAKHNNLLAVDLRESLNDSTHFFWKQKEYKALYKRKNIYMSNELLSQFKPQEPDYRQRAVNWLLVLMILLISYIYKAWGVIGITLLGSVVCVFSYYDNSTEQANQRLLASPVMAEATIDYYDAGSGGKNSRPSGWVYHFEYQGQRVTSKSEPKNLVPTIPVRCISKGTHFPVWFCLNNPYSSKVDWWTNNCH